MCDEAEYAEQLLEAHYETAADAEPAEDDVEAHVRAIAESDPDAVLRVAASIAPDEPFGQSTPAAASPDKAEEFLSILDDMIGILRNIPHTATNAMWRAMFPAVLAERLSLISKALGFERAPVELKALQLPGLEGRIGFTVASPYSRQFVTMAVESLGPTSPQFSEENRSYLISTLEQWRCAVQRLVAADASSIYYIMRTETEGTRDVSYPIYRIRGRSAAEELAKRVHEKFAGGVTVGPDGLKIVDLEQYRAIPASDAPDARAADEEIEALARKAASGDPSDDARVYLACLEWAMVRNGEAEPRMTLAADPFRAKSAVPVETRAAGQVSQRRKSAGRLPKEESETKRTLMLAKIRQHDSMKDDPASLV